jgi:ABC-type hemin transport system ATPase subunit
VHAVRDVGFTVGYGEIVALLGPNGAGKTTTLEILEGFRTRDGGTAEVLGYDPGARSSARELRERTGLVLQDIAVEPYLTVRETIARAAGYYRAPRGVAEVIGLAGLTGLERRKVRSLSGGQKRRLDLPVPSADLPVPAQAADGMVVVETGAPTQALHQLTDWAIRHGHVLAGLTVGRPSLEDVYLELTREGAPARAPERIMR